MKFHLLKNKIFKLPSAVIAVERGLVSNYDFKVFWSRWVTLPVTIKPTDDHQTSLYGGKCALVKHLLEKGLLNESGQSTSIREQEFWKLELLFGISRGKVRDQTPASGIIKLNWINPGDCLNKLVELFPEAKIQVELGVCEDELEEDPWHEKVSKLRFYKSKEMTVGGKGNTLFQDVEVFLPTVWRSIFLAPWCIVTITVTISEDCLSIPLNLPFEYADAAMEIKAIRNFLATCSSVWAPAFQGDMKEVWESMVKIRDMEGKSARAFLNFLYYDSEEDEDFGYRYYKGREDTEWDFPVAWELFQAGVKYRIPSLERKMRELILNKSVDWFEMDDALKLYVFAGKLYPPDKDLKEKAVKALVQYSVAGKESPILQELSPTDYKALELFKCSLEHSSA